MRVLTKQQIDTANSLKWYHALEFGEHQTIGRFKPNTPPNVTLFGVMDLLKEIDVNGMHCLDVGPAHGLISFGLALRGAQVVTTNVGGGKPPQFSLAEEIYGISVDYRHGVPLASSAEVFRPGTFDLIVIAGVMYHLLNPADVFFQLRPLLKRNGLLVVETVYAPGYDAPVLALNSELQSVFPQPTTYFLPSESALRGLAKLACFETLATRISEPSRFALIAKAVLPAEVNERTDMCIDMHRVGFEDPSFDIASLSAERSFSDIAYSGTTGHRVIDTRRYVPDFPSHPKTITNPLGQPFYT